jgi:hypothetical protein
MPLHEAVAGEAVPYLLELDVGITLGHGDLERPPPDLDRVISVATAHDRMPVIMGLKETARMAGEIGEARMLGVGVKFGKTNLSISGRLCNTGSGSRPTTHPGRCDTALCPIVSNNHHGPTCLMVAGDDMLDGHEPWVASTNAQAATLPMMPPMSVHGSGTSSSKDMSTSKAGSVGLAMFSHTENR